MALKWGEGVDRAGQPYGWLVDCRELLLQGPYLHYACHLLWEKLKPYQPEFVGGLTLAANPLTVGLLYESRADGSPVDALIIRREPKKDGLKKQVEGPALTPGRRVALVDDILNSGETQRQALAALKPFDCEVPVVGVLVDYQKEGREWLLERGFAVEALFTLAELGVAFVEPSSTSLATLDWTFSPLNRGEYSAPKSTPCWVEDSVVVGSDQGFVVSLQGGEERWRFEVRDKERGVHSSPCLADGRVYFGAYDGYLYCVDALTGKLVWEARPGQWIGSSPVARDGLVYVGLEYGESGGSLIAVDGASGQTSWELRAGDYMHGTPCLWEDLVIVGANDGVLRAANARCGTPVWEFTAAGPFKAQPVVDEDGTCFAGSHDGRLYAVDARTGLLRWSKRLSAQLYFTPVVYEDLVIAGGLSARLLGLDRRTGSVRWVRAAGGGLMGGAALLGDRVVVGAGDGSVLLFAAGTGELLWRHKTGGRILGKAAVAGTQFVIPSCDGSLYAFSASLSSNEKA